MTDTTNQGDVLIVDDTPANLTVLSTILTQHGYKVRPANNGQVALTIAEKACPDLILLDIQMPGMDGYTTCQKLKESPTTRDIPVIFVSALGEVMDKVRAFDAGGVDYISKPFQILEVLSRVQTHIRLHHHQEKLKKAVPAAMQDLDSLLEKVRTLPGTETTQQMTALIEQLKATIGEL